MTKFDRILATIVVAMLAFGGAYLLAGIAAVMLTAGCLLAVGVAIKNATDKIITAIDTSAASPAARH
jgi:hypothetical protein